LFVHERLHEFRTNNEWFSHMNTKYFQKTVSYIIDEVIFLFYSFSYELKIESMDLEEPWEKIGILFLNKQNIATLPSPTIHDLS
jgi:hypothetical protein